MPAATVDIYDINRALEARDVLNGSLAVGQAPARLVKTDTRTGYEVPMTDEERATFEEHERKKVSS